MHELFFEALGAAFGVLVTIGWSRWNYARSAPPELGGGGTITPGKISAAVVTFLGLAIALAGTGLIFQGRLNEGLICLVLGIPMALFMLPSLTHVHDLAWNATEVSGPCGLFGPGLGRRRTTIPWNEITATGKTITSFWFIQSRDGRRIYWSYLYPGYGRFVESLMRKRPELELPKDLH